MPGLNPRCMMGKGKTTFRESERRRRRRRRKREFASMFKSRWIKSPAASLSDDNNKIDRIAGRTGTRANYNYRSTWAHMLIIYINCFAFSLMVDLIKVSPNLRWYVISLVSQDATMVTLSLFGARLRRVCLTHLSLTVNYMMTLIGRISIFELQSRFVSTSHKFQSDQNEWLSNRYH